MKIIIDEVPLSKNKFMNMRTKNFYAMEAKRKKYKERIYWLIYWKKGKGWFCKKATITFDIFFKVNRKRDTQNYLGGGLIAWLDALVDNHIILDDNSDCIGQPIVNFYVDKANPRTEITIEGR